MTVTAKLCYTLRHRMCVCGEYNGRANEENFLPVCFYCYWRPRPRRCWSRLTLQAKSVWSTPIFPVRIAPWWETFFPDRFSTILRHPPPWTQQCQALRSTRMRLRLLRFRVRLLAGKARLAALLLATALIWIPSSKLTRFCVPPPHLYVGTR